MNIKKEGIKCSNCATIITNSNKCEKCGRSVLASMADLITLKNTNGKKDEVIFGLYLQSANMENDSYGQFNVGYCYEFGFGVNKDIEKAISYYKKAINNDNMQALIAMGDLYYKGKGVDKSLDTAISLYKKALKDENVNAIFKLGLCYYEKEQYDKALFMFEKAYKLGRKKACLYIMLSLFNNKDYIKAEEFVNDLKEKTDGYSILAIGLSYLKGIVNPQDFNVAFTYFEKAKSKMVKEANYYLGLCYLNGKGIEKDEFKAYSLFESGSTRTDENCIKVIVYCLENGIGCEKDLEKAEYWKNKM